VRFAHGGWTDANTAPRAKFGDWPLLLGRFAALAECGGRGGRAFLPSRIG
jgi:hypothetical protein